MARMNQEEAERFSSSTNGEWFRLKNDGDVARIQFLYDTYDDLEHFVAHRVQVGDYERYVDCLRQSYDSPVEDCPFCAAGIEAKPARFIAMYQHEDKKVKVWERGAAFLKRLQGLFNRYTPLSDYVFEIERRGKAGDQRTTYEIYPMDRVDPEDVSQVERPKILGGIILEKTAEEMEYYLDHDEFENDDRQAQPERREDTRGNGRRAPVENSEVRPRGRRSESQEEAPRSRTNRGRRTDADNF